MGATGGSGVWPV